MSTSTAAVRASTSASSTPQFWERLWRTAGVQSVGLFVVAYFVYGNQPHVGASTEALVAFYQGDRMRILIAATDLDAMLCAASSHFHHAARVIAGDERERPHGFQCVA